MRRAPLKKGDKVIFAQRDLFDDHLFLKQGIISSNFCSYMDGGMYVDFDINGRIKRIRVYESCLEKLD